MGVERARAQRLEELRATARYHRTRRDVYLAKVLGPRATSPARLEELQRVCDVSESRLRRAELATSHAAAEAAR